MSKIWKVLQWVIVVVLMVVGLALIFNEQIKSYVVNHMSQTAISKPVDTKTKHKGNFDFESVKAVDIKGAFFSLEPVHIPYMRIPARLRRRTR